MDIRWIREKAVYHSKFIGWSLNWVIERKKEKKRNGNKIVLKRLWHISTNPLDLNTWVVIISTLKVSPFMCVKDLLKIYVIYKTLFDSNGPKYYGLISFKFSNFIFQDIFLTKPKRFFNDLNSFFFLVDKIFNFNIW